MSVIDTVVVDSLKVLDPDGRLEKRPKCWVIGVTHSLALGGPLRNFANQEVVTDNAIEAWYHFAIAWHDPTGGSHGKSH